jgi:hypothetical protein
MILGRNLDDTLFGVQGLLLKGSLHMRRSDYFQVLLVELCNAFFKEAVYWWLIANLSYHKLDDSPSLHLFLVIPELHELLFLLEHLLSDVIHSSVIMFRHRLVSAWGFANESEDLLPHYFT